MIDLIRYIGAACVFLVIFIIGWVIFEMTWAIPFHNYRLWVIERNFNAVNSQNFAQSRLLAKKAEVSHWGNSNLCDYNIGQFRASAISREEIENAYAGLSIPSYKNDGEAPLELEVYFLDNEYLWPYFWMQWWEENSAKFALASSETPYLVFASSDSHSPAGDLRCH